jgi:hypothetical protein
MLRGLGWCLIINYQRTAHKIAGERRRRKSDYLKLTVSIFNMCVYFTLCKTVYSIEADFLALYFVGMRETVIPIVRWTEYLVFIFVTFMWPCIVTNFFVIKPTRCTNSQIYLVMKLYMFRTARLSIIRSLFTVHSAMVYVIQVCRQHRNKFLCNKTN